MTSYDILWLLYTIVIYSPVVSGTQGNQEIPGTLESASPPDSPWSSRQPAAERITQWLSSAD